MQGVPKALVGGQGHVAWGQLRLMAQHGESESWPALAAGAPGDKDIAGMEMRSGPTARVWVMVGAGLGAGWAKQHRRATCPSSGVGIDWCWLAAAALRGILMPQLFISRLSSYVFKYRILGFYDKIKQHLLEN